MTLNAGSPALPRGLSIVPNADEDNSLFNMFDGALVTPRATALESPTVGAVGLAFAAPASAASSPRIGIRRDSSFSFLRAAAVPPLSSPQGRQSKTLAPSQVNDLVSAWETSTGGKKRPHPSALAAADPEYDEDDADDGPAAATAAAPAHPSVTDDAAPLDSDSAPRPAAAETPAADDDDDGPEHNQDPDFDPVADRPKKRPRGRPPKNKGAKGADAKKGSKPRGRPPKRPRAKGDPAVNESPPPAPVVPPHAPAPALVLETVDAKDSQELMPPPTGRPARASARIRAASATASHSYSFDDDDDITMDGAPSELPGFSDMDEEGRSSSSIVLRKLLDSKIIAPAVLNAKIKDSELSEEELKQWKRLRRMVKNRQSAHLSRQRKREYMGHLEKKNAELRDRIEALERPARDLGIVLAALKANHPAIHAEMLALLSA